MNKHLLQLSFLKTFFDAKIATIFDLHNNCDKQANHSGHASVLFLLPLLQIKKSYSKIMRLTTIVKLTSFNPHVLAERNLRFVAYSH